MRKLIEKAASKPLILLLVIIALTAIFITALGKNAVLETNLDAYMPSGHPAFVFSDEAEELFGIEDAVLFAIEHPETIFNQGTLEKIAELSTALAERFDSIEYSDITSLYGAENITSGVWGLEVEPFYTRAPGDADELDEIRRKVEANEMVHGRLVSKDNRATLVIAEIHGQAFTGSFYEELTAFAKEWEGPETIHVAGRPIVEGELGKLGPKDMTRMAPLVMIIMSIVLFLLLRSVRDTIINMIIVLFGTVAAFGTKTLLGIPVYSVDTMIPVMLIAIGVAYGIHMHNAIHHLYLKHPGISRNELVDRTLQAMIRPVFMTALTTAIGFSALMTSQVLPVRYFGLFASLGVMIEMVMALLLFPASVYLFGVPKKGRKKSDGRSKGTDLEAVKKTRGDRLLTRSRPIIFVGIAVLIFALFGTSRVQIETSFLANFSRQSSIVQTDKFVNDHFGGTSTLNIILTAEDADQFKEPRILELIDDMQQEIEADPLVGTSFGISDYMRRMHKVMHDEDPAFDKIPESREMVAQYLLLYEMSGDPDNLNRIVDYDYRNANLTVQLKSDSSREMKRIIDITESYKDLMAESDIMIRYAGSGYKALVFADLLLEGQIISLLLSFILVALLLTLMFRKLLIGLIGTIPIALTAAINFGTMGLLGIPLSSATALISSIAIGIGVDYAIHLIEHYTRIRQRGVTIHEAAIETLSHTGRAIVFNALAVMGGFAVLLTSVFPPNRQVGALITLNMASSAIGTLTLLLLILVALDKKGKIITTTSGGRR